MLTRVDFYFVTWSDWGLNTIFTRNPSSIWSLLYATCLYLSACFVIKTIDVHIFQPLASSTSWGFLGAGLLVLIFLHLQWNVSFLFATRQSLFYFIVADCCFSWLLNSTPLVNTSVGQKTELFNILKIESI